MSNPALKILVSYRGIPQSPGWATGDMVVKAFRKLGHDAYPYAKYYQENRWVEGKPNGLDNHDWDLVLFMECNDGDPQYPELRIVRSRKTACWLFDTSYHEDRYSRLVKYFGFDYIFLANPVTIQEYKTSGYKNVFYMPYACDEELHYRPIGNKIHEAALVGSIRQDRINLKNNLKRHGVELELIGGIYREQYIDALAASHVIVNQNPDLGRGLLNMRFFEAQAAGSLVLTERFDHEINQSYGLMSAALSYDNPQQIANIVKNTKDFNYSSIQNHTLKYNTYVNRCDGILKSIFSNEIN